MENENLDVKYEIDNLSIPLYNAHKKSINGVRQKLFLSFDNKSLLLGKAARDIYYKKTKSTSKSTLPQMFELFPWVIKDLAGLSHKETKKISVSWLAIYLYVSFLDEHLDMKTEINANEFLGASVLAQHGLLNLFKIVNGTRFERIFTNSLFSSASFQLEDVLEQTKINENKFGKAKAAAGKNKILIACAGALAATKEDKSSFILEITNKLLLSIQFLDDLGDFEDDFKQNNITILLNSVAKENKLDILNFSRNELIGKLIESGSLLNVIRKIEESLSTAIQLIECNLNGNKKENSSYTFFTALYLSILTFSKELSEYQTVFLDLPVDERNVIIEKVDKSIRKIYFHT